MTDDYKLREKRLDSLTMPCALFIPSTNGDPMDDLMLAPRLATWKELKAAKGYKGNLPSTRKNVGVLMDVLGPYMRGDPAATVTDAIGRFRKAAP